MSIFERQVEEHFDWSKAKHLITPINGKVWLETEHTKPKDITTITAIVLTAAFTILFI